MSLTRRFGPSMSAVKNGECHVVISTSASAICCRSSDESSRKEDLVQAATSSSFSRAAGGKKCWNKTSLANTRTLGRITAITNETAHCIYEIGQRDLRFFNFRVPILLPLKTYVSVVVQSLENHQRLGERHVPTTSQHWQPVF